MAKEKETNLINPMTGEQLIRSKNVLVYGITDVEFAIVVDSLPNKDIRVIDCSGCFTDLIALPYIAAIIDPTSLTKEDIETLNEYVDEVQYLTERYVFTNDDKILDNLSKNLKHTILTAEELSDKLRYILLEANRAEKKYDTYSDTVAQTIRVLAEIRMHPYITTTQLADKIERTPRTVQRYITTLNCAGEFIEYDRKKKGWFLFENKSVLWGDY